MPSRPGTPFAEEQALESLKAAGAHSFAEALSAALTAWGIGRSQLAPKKASDSADEYELDPVGEASSDAPKVSDDPTVALARGIQGWTECRGGSSWSGRRPAKPSSGCSAPRNLKPRSPNTSNSQRFNYSLCIEKRSSIEGRFFVPKKSA